MLENISTSGTPFKTIVDFARERNIPIDIVNEIDQESAQELSAVAHFFRFVDAFDEWKGSVEMSGLRIEIEKDSYVHPELCLVHELTHLYDCLTLPGEESIPLASERQQFFINRLREARADAMAFVYADKNKKRFKEYFEKGQRSFRYDRYKSIRKKFKNDFEYAFTVYSSNARDYNDYAGKFLNYTTKTQRYKASYENASWRAGALSKAKTPAEFVYEVMAAQEKKINFLYRRYAQVPDSRKKFYDVKRMTDYNMVSPITAMAKLDLLMGKPDKQEAFGWNERGIKIYERNRAKSRDTNLRLANREIKHIEWLSETFEYFQEHPEDLRNSPALGQTKSIRYRQAVRSRRAAGQLGLTAGR